MGHTRGRQPHDQGQDGQRQQHSRPREDRPRPLRQDDEVGRRFQVGHTGAGHSHHEHVAGLDSLIAQPGPQVRALPPDAEHQTAEAVAKSHGRNREAAAGEAGTGDQFEHRGLLVFGLQATGREVSLRRELHALDLREPEDVVRLALHQDHVAHEERLFGGREAQTAAVADDLHDGNIEARPPAKLSQGLADQRRAGRDADFRQVVASLGNALIDVRPLPVRYQTMANRHEIQQTGGEDCRAGGGEVEHAERPVAGRGQRVADQQVRRGADLGHQPAQHGTEGQGHEQARGGGVGGARQGDRRRHHNHRGGDVVDEGRHAADHHDQQDGQDDNASSAVTNDRGGQGGRRSSLHQPGAEDEHGGDGDYRRAGESGEGGRRVDHAGQGQHQQHQQAHAFGRQPLAGEQHQRTDHAADDDPGFWRHRAPPTPKRFTP